MSVPRLLPVSLLLLSGIGLTAAPVAAGPPWFQSARAELNDRVNQYVELHRTIAAAFGAEETCGDPEQLQSNVDDFADAIREARPGARLGDIFTPHVAWYLKAYIGAVVERTGVPVAAVVEEMEEETISEVVLPDVNGSFPWGLGNAIWPSILRELPPLPEELEYRFVGRDLVLLDMRANLVVDILEEALPLERATPRHPCDVHPELPECWM